MKTLFIAFFALVTYFPGQSQIKNASSIIVKVYGNCGMCEEAIEKAADQKRIAKADWNEETKMVTITYDSKKTDQHAILKKIALAGYDNQEFLAPDDAYNNLPACCKYNRELKNAAMVSIPGNNSTESGPLQNNHPHNKLKNAATETDQLKKVFDNYFELKDALVQSDATMASAKAKNLVSAIEKVNRDKLDQDVHLVWMKVAKGLKEDAVSISGAGDIVLQRKHFINLSENMYQLVKIAKPAETVYFQHCPMANDGNGANWLSKESNIKNPYYGSRMLTCGKILETIKE